MMTTSDSGTLRTLLTTLYRYRNGEMSLRSLKSARWATAEAAVAFEDRELREFLQFVEGNLDVIEFTTEASASNAMAMDVLIELEQRV